MFKYLSISSLKAVLEQLGGIIRPGGDSLDNGRNSFPERGVCVNFKQVRWSPSGHSDGLSGPAVVVIWPLCTCLMNVDFTKQGAQIQALTALFEI